MKKNIENVVFDETLPEKEEQKLTEEELEKRPVVIDVSHVDMEFILNKQKVDNLKEFVIRKIKGNIEVAKFKALDDITFQVRKGERLAIMGLNGAGFDPEYTGKENIYLYGAILGYSREFLDTKIQDIIDFSELGDFINVPLKNYSSGMKSRLGFSIATAVEPDILILDEVLSVGDARFRRKSLAKVQSMFDNGVTVLFVSHSIDQVLAICDRAILLQKGKIIAEGTAEEVAVVYEEKTGRGPKNKI